MQLLHPTRKKAWDVRLRVATARSFKGHRPCLSARGRDSLAMFEKLPVDESPAAPAANCSSEPGHSGLSWEPADSINPYAARPGKANPLDVGLSAKRSTFGHCPTGRLKVPPGTKVLETGTKVPGPHYDVMTKLDAPTCRFAKDDQRPKDGKNDGNPVNRSPGPIYDRADKLGKQFAYTYENTPRISMGVKLPSYIFSPRTEPYNGPLGTLPSRGGTHQRGAGPPSSTGVPASFGKQVEGKKTSAPFIQFGKELQRPPPSKTLFQGKEQESMFRGKDSIQVPTFEAHTKGFYQSPRHQNSPRFTMSKDVRF